MFKIHQEETPAVGVLRFESADESYDYGSDLDCSFTEGMNDGCRGFSSVDSEYKLLRLDVASDISFVESMEREMAIEMMRDKIELRRGMKGMDSTTIQFDKLTNAERMAALKYVKDRVRKLRQAKRRLYNNNKSPTKCNKENVVKSAAAKSGKPPIKHSLRKKSERKSRVPIPLRSITNMQSANRQSNMVVGGKKKIVM